MKYLPLFILSFLLLACGTQNGEQSTQILLSPADSLSGEPNLFTAANEQVFLSWIETKGDMDYLKYSTLQENLWSEPSTIAMGDSWFVNWADFPSMAVLENGSMIAHYLDKSGDGTYAYDVKVSQSNDQGKNWSEGMVVHDDGKQAEHGFATMLPYQDQFFITWLDGRNTVGDGHEENTHDSSSHGSMAGAMTIRAALIDDEGNKSMEWELDDRVCDCCQTTAAITTNGPVVIYRDRSEKEVRDMSIVRWTGSDWTAPKSIYPDNWKINGCPVNGPRADALNNTLAIAWFTAPEGRAEVKVIFSNDGGASFDEPLLLDSAKAVGRVDITLLDENAAIVSWMEGADIKAKKVLKDGSQKKTVIIASSSAARASGFPQMTKSNDKLIFAWTDNDKKRVKTSVWGLSDFD